jgi:uncharacterized protein YbjT (DUF2867 family)
MSINVQVTSVVAVLLATLFLFSVPNSVPHGNACRIIAVLGATGSQGGSLIAAVQKFNQESRMSGRSSPFCLRVLTRSQYNSTDSQLAVVRGDMSSRDTMRVFLKGAWGLFLVTFSDFSGGEEEAVGVMIAEEALAAKVQHLVFSSGIRTGVAFMDVKARIEARLQGMAFSKMVFLQSGFFYENFIVKGGRPRVVCREDAGSLRVQLSSPLAPDLPVAMHAASDIGALAALSFVAPERFAHNVSVRVVGDVVTPLAYSVALTEVARITGVALLAQYEPLSIDHLRALVWPLLLPSSFPPSFLLLFLPPPLLALPAELQIPGADGERIADMYTWFNNGGMAPHDVLAPAQRAAVPEALTLRAWLAMEGLSMVTRLCRAQT